MQAIINFFTGTLNTVAWLYIFLPCTILGGLYLTIRNRGIQFTKFGYTMKNTLGKMFQKHKVYAMQVGKENRILILIFLCWAVALPGACTYKGGDGERFLKCRNSILLQHSQRFRSDGAALDESTGIAENGKDQR